MSIYSTILDLFRAVSVDDGGTDEIRVNVTSSVTPTGGATEAKQDVLIADLTPNVSLVSGSVSVSTTQIEAKVGGSPLANRSRITIENKGNPDIFLGPTGVTSTTGIKLVKNQTRDMEIGPSISIFMITASGTATVIVQELS